MTGASMAQTSRQTLGIQLCKSGTKKRIGLAFVFGALLFLDRDGWLGIRTTQRPQAGTPMDEEGFAPTSTWVPYLPCHREADRSSCPRYCQVLRTCEGLVVRRRKGGQLVRPLTAPILASRVCRNHLVPPSGLSVKKTPTLDQIPHGAAAAAKWRHACSR